MKTDKYKRLIKQRILQTMDTWSSQPAVEEQDIHRFFHNLKGTCGTIGLTEVEKYSDQKELLFSADSHKQCVKEEWEQHLKPLIALIPVEIEPIGLPEAVPNDIEDLDNNRNRVLVIDDDVDFVAYVKEFLEKQSYPVTIALNAERGLKLFYDWKPGLILLDIVLPDKSGMYVLNQMVEKAKQGHIPIIMISANVSIENQIHAYRSGAMDFLAKPFDVDLLLALIDNRFAMKREWERSIVIDELTGAYNRKHYNGMMQQFIANYNRSNKVFSLVMMDLDYFKHVNDNYGHLKGDEVLQAFVAAIHSLINQDEDILCRYGGEEFALLLPNKDSTEAALLLDQIRERFNAIRFQAGEEHFHVTFSAGVTQISTNNSDTEKLVEEADQALYSGKRSGRNQTIVYTKELSEIRYDSFLNVIIVDDDPLIREIVINRFSHWKPLNNTKVQAYEYSDGMDFISSDWYKEDEKYIIMLDGSMPTLDGLEVLRRIREHYPEQNILIVMLTARNNTNDIVHALQIGADDYVVKPFHMQELVLRIERLASRILS
ncbi:diguanylate cyclase (GGDEF)-like protein [Paenibacillus castaneae]|uniref:GGDEF domain-containing response regulator n=1 Tax=Paenibacillus castaneae TaxID=474957 RepID=UPI000C9B8B63|nr:response regulator [Paenibacillus castaneae]NIK76762.1 diguanylate cyclase (GGDEF)-like protein [Paenibacillus castaneae]